MDAEKKNEKSVDSFRGKGYITIDIRKASFLLLA